MVASGAVGYLIGSLPLGYLAARGCAGVDLRRVGSGNVGATNVWRVSGLGLGLVVMVLDIGKGVTAVVVAGLMTPSESDAVVAGVAAVVGHVFPLWLRGKGGKGVATAAGAFGLLAPAATFCAAAAFAVTAGVTGFVSVASVLATIALPLAGVALGASPEVVFGAVLTAVLVVSRHRANLRRIRSGAEPRLTRPSVGESGA